MTEPFATTPPVVVVTGANGLVGSRICADLVDRGASVRALVRKSGTAPALAGVEEYVGDFYDLGLASSALEGADAAITTVHPMGTSAGNQRRIGVEGTVSLAHAAASAGVARLIHISTAAVYDRSPEAGDVDEGSPLVGDDANAYAVTKRDTDEALAEVAGITRVLLRPPAILGPGRTSVWNSLRPTSIREHESERHAVREQTFAWVHVVDLAALAADVATGRVAAATDPGLGPVDGGCTPVNLASAPASVGDYFETVTRAVGVEPVWDTEPAWTGSILTTRARAWGWSPTVTKTDAFQELADGLRGDQ